MNEIDLKDWLEARKVFLETIQRLLRRNLDAAEFYKIKVELNARCQLEFSGPPDLVNKAQKFLDIAI
jgi:hypothetical protein